MSWWVSLEDITGDCVTVDRFSDGGTYVLGGATEASLNITYNYGRHYRDTLDSERGLRALHGERAAMTIARLEAAVETLGTRRDADYWAATPGNAGAALAVLLGWARQHPNAVFRVN